MGAHACHIGASSGCRTEGCSEAPQSRCPPLGELERKRILPGEGAEMYKVRTQERTREPRCVCVDVHHRRAA